MSPKNLWKEKAAPPAGSQYTLKNDKIKNLDKPPLSYMYKLVFPKQNETNKG